MYDKSELYTVSRTPVRVSLFGGGTDFPEFYIKHGGACLSFTIGKYITVSVRRRNDREIHLAGEKKDVASEWSKLGNSLVRAALQLSGLDNGWDIRIDSDLPANGTGLGTSSSVSVGLLNSLAAANEQYRTSHELALLACRLEREVLQKPIGVQDQFAVAYGGLRFLEFRTDGSVEISSLSYETGLGEKICEYLMLFSTGKQRESSDILQEQRANIPQKIGELRRIRELAYRARASLLEGRLSELGSMLAESWTLKRQLGSRISFPDVDIMYDRARLQGATGGKICGAGGGGFLLLWVPPTKRRAVRNALGQYRELKCEFTTAGSEIVFEPTQVKTGVQDVNQ